MEQIFVLIDLSIGASGVNPGIRNTNLTNLIGSTGHRITLNRFEDFDVVIRQRNTDRADLLNPFRRIDRYQTGRLGQAIALTDRHATGLFKAFKELHRHRGRAGKRGFNCRYIGIDWALH